ncbi:hypothetical protein [[Kitasatospora] papulosa]|uniref:hypothetical protein n=1 Tax=[Kitasatospora] papulosa TaxID=1464011 RepID=UPI00368EA8E8
MKTLSQKTLNRMIQIAKGWPTSDIRDLLMEANLATPLLTDSRLNRQELLRESLLDAHKIASRNSESTRERSRTAHEALLDFARCIAEFNPNWQDEDRTTDLRESLRSDGYELVVEVVSASSGSYRYKASLLPFDPDGAPLHPEMTALEHELSARSYTEALGHYRLAVKHFSEQDHASSNGQLRTALEALIVNLAADHTSYTDTGKANQGGIAVKSLYSQNGQGPAVLSQPLPERDGGRMLQGIWDISHLNGSHPGLSDAQEARIRMQLVTALAQFLLRHFPVQA